MSGGWWRRNGLALGALVVLVPVGMWAFDTIEFGSARNSHRDVPANEQIHVGDWTFSAPEITPVDPEGVGAPAGSDPVVVRIAVTPGDDAVRCALVALIDPETGREWRQSFGLQWSSDDDDRNYCPSPVDDEGSSARPFDLTAFMLLPADAPRRLVVELQGSLSSDDFVTDIRTEVTR